ncbi:MAG: hypothetical protein UT57_C0018G0008 [Microgenomates group bacterium GW2011_GWC1_39_7]|nr:MAG: hypothetical protein UT57_C0018G0008 [Microgenomates group bacterium GW2011_GWC1_39_7]
MSSKELGYSSENLDWIPSITLRPHHVRFMPRRGIKRLKLSSPINFFSSLIATSRYTRDDDYYYRDAFGEFGTPEGARRERLRKLFLQELKDMPNDAIVQLDLSADGFYNTCPIGKHCGATNYESRDKREQIDVVALEMAKLEAIRKKMLAKGLREQVDFKLTQSTHTLFDYHSENLWRNLQPPQPKVVQFTAMLVKMGALRRII